MVYVNTLALFPFAFYVADFQSFFNSHCVQSELEKLSLSGVSSNTSAIIFKKCYPAYKQEANVQSLSKEENSIQSNENSNNNDTDNNDKQLFINLIEDLNLNNSNVGLHNGSNSNFFYAFNNENSSAVEMDNSIEKTHIYIRNYLDDIYSKVETKLSLENHPNCEVLIEKYKENSSIIDPYYLQACLQVDLAVPNYKDYVDYINLDDYISDPSNMKKRDVSFFTEEENLNFARDLFLIINHHKFLSKNNPINKRSLDDKTDYVSVSVPYAKPVSSPFDALISSYLNDERDLGDIIADEEDNNYIEKKSTTYSNCEILIQKYKEDSSSIDKYYLQSCLQIDLGIQNYNDYLDYVKIDDYISEISHMIKRDVQQYNSNINNKDGLDESPATQGKFAKYMNLDSTKKPFAFLSKRYIASQNEDFPNIELSANNFLHKAKRFSIMVDISSMKDFFDIWSDTNSESDFETESETVSEAESKTASESFPDPSQSNNSEPLSESSLSSRHENYSELETTDYLNVMIPSLENESNKIHDFLNEYYKSSDLDLKAADEFLDYFIKVQRQIYDKVHHEKPMKEFIGPCYYSEDCPVIIGRDFNSQPSTVSWYRDWYLDMDTIYRRTKIFGKYRSPQDPSITKRTDKYIVTKNDESKNIVDDNSENSESRMELYEAMKKVDTANISYLENYTICGYPDALSFVYQSFSDRLLKLSKDIIEINDDVRIANVGEFVDCLQYILEYKVEKIYEDVINAKNQYDNSIIEIYQMAEIMFLSITTLNSKMNNANFPNIKYGCSETFNHNSNNTWLVIDKSSTLLNSCEQPKVLNKLNIRGSSTPGGYLSTKQLQEILQKLRLYKKLEDGTWVKKLDSRSLKLGESLFSSNRFPGLSDKKMLELVYNSNITYRSFYPPLPPRLFENKDRNMSKRELNNSSDIVKINTLSNDTSLASGFFDNFRYSADIHKAVSATAWSINAAICATGNVPLCVGFIVVPLFFTVFGGVYYDPNPSTNSNDIQIQNDSFPYVGPINFVWSDFNDEINEIYSQTNESGASSAIAQLPDTNGVIEVSFLNNIRKYSIEGSAVFISSGNSNINQLHSVDLYIKGKAREIPTAELNKIIYKITENANEKRYSRACICIKNDKNEPIHGEIVYNGDKLWDYRDECSIGC